MKTTHEEPAVAADGRKAITLMSCEPLSRREFLAGSAAVGATICLTGTVSAAQDGKKTFTILHTNDLHSNFIGLGPAQDYTPFTLNDDTTRGGYALINTFAVKMAAVFIIVTSSIGLRTAISPRWMAFVGYALALVMLLTIADFAWIALVFPSWVLLLSAYILFTDFGRKHQVATRAEAKAPHEGTAAGD